MNKEFIAEYYTSPDVYVIKIKAQSVVCSSITEMKLGPEQDDNTF